MTTLIRWWHLAALMKYLFIVFVFAISVLLVVPSITQAATTTPGIRIEKTWGGTDGDSGEGVAVDSVGNIYITGYTLNFGAGSADVVLLKYDSSGSLQWQRTAGGSGYDIGYAVALDSSGNIYVTGSTTSQAAGLEELLVLKFDSSGNLQWQRTWGTSNYEAGMSVAVDSAGGGGIYVTGYSASFGSTDVVLLKFDSSGNLLWQRNWDGGGQDEGHGVAVDSSGSVYVSGFAGSGDIVLLKFSSSGDLLWQRTWGGTGADQGHGVAVDASGSVYVTGYTTSVGAGVSYVVLLKIDASGNLQWQRAWGGGQDHFDSGYGIATDSSGNIYITGYSTVGSYPHYVLLLKFDSSGNHQWHMAFFGSHDSQDPGWGNSADVDSSGNPVFTGKIMSAQPYYLDDLVFGNLVTPTFSLGTPTFSLGEPSTAAETPAFVIGTPSGSESWAGGKDVYLLSVGTVAPAFPRDPSAVGQSGQTLVQWQTPFSDGGSPITGYNLYRGTSSGEETLYQTLGVVLSYTDPSVTCQTKYYYKVTAVNAVGESSPSAEVSAASSCPPSAPQGPVAVGGANQIMLTWQPPTSDGGSAVTGYRVYRSSSPGAEVLLYSIGPVTTYADPSVTCQTTYYYRVGAVNSAGEGSLSNEASAASYCPPSSPQNLDATGQTNRIMLSWQVPASDGGPSITGYNVYRGTSPNTESLLASLGVVTSHTDTSVVNGIIYYYRVTALNNAGESGFSNEASATIAETGTLKIVVSATNTNSPIQAATVTITSAPAGQTLPPSMTTGFDGIVTFTGLVPGDYTYKVTANGYEDQQGSAAVIAGQTQSAELTLTVVGPPFNWILLGVVISVVVAAGLIGTYVYRRNIQARRVKP